VSSTPETEWDAEQQAWAVALGVYRTGLCPVCGGDLEECGQAGVWEVPAPRRCHRTDALMLAQEARTNTSRPGALMWRVQKKQNT
jgi:hypothetical protein